MNVGYRVDLSQAERDELDALVSGGKQPVRRLKRMQILLAADAGIGDEAIAASARTSGSTIYRAKKRFVEIRLEAALGEEPRPGAARKLSGKQEARLVALACSDPPEDVLNGSGPSEDGQIPSHALARRVMITATGTRSTSLKRG
jgi:hypothetical protein